MGNVISICISFMVIVFFLCLYGMWYIRRWEEKNSWYKQDDNELPLSEQERAYRQNEIRKYGNVLFTVFGCMFVCMVPVSVLLQKENIGYGSSFTTWIYSLPFIGVALWSFSCIKRK